MALEIPETYCPFEKAELYDPAQDPGETTNLALTEPVTTQALSGQLGHWINRHPLYYNAPEYYSQYNPPK